MKYAVVIFIMIFGFLILYFIAGIFSLWPGATLSGRSFEGNSLEDTICDVVQHRIFDSFELKQIDFPERTIRLKHIKKLKNGFSVQSWFYNRIQNQDSTKVLFNSIVRFDSINQQYNVESISYFKVPKHALLLHQFLKDVPLTGIHRYMNKSVPDLFKFKKAEQDIYRYLQFKNPRSIINDDEEILTFAKNLTFGGRIAVQYYQVHQKKEEIIFSTAIIGNKEKKCGDDTLYLNIKNYTYWLVCEYKDSFNLPLRKWEELKRDLAEQGYFEENYLPPQTQCLDGDIQSSYYKSNHKEVFHHAICGDTLLTSFSDVLYNSFYKNSN